MSIQEYKEKTPAYDPLLLGEVGEGGNVLLSRWVYSAEEEAEARAAGLLPVLKGEPPISADPTITYEPQYIVTEALGLGPCIDTTYKEVRDVAYIEERILELKAEIAATDYMWVKTYEARVMGKDDPYTAEELATSAAEREGLRAQINALEILLY